MCRLFNNKEKKQIHVLQEFSALEQLNVQKSTMENIFKEDLKILKEAEVSINNIMEKFQNSWPYKGEITVPPMVELPGNLAMYTKIVR